MTRFLRSLALVLVALAAPVQGAQAQSIAETLSRWGLLGTWALDCSKPASGSNGYLTYAIRRAGQVSHERDFGDRQDVNEVQQARLVLGGALELVVHFPELSQTRQVHAADGRGRPHPGHGQQQGRRHRADDQGRQVHRQRRQHTLAGALPLSLRPLPPSYWADAQRGR